MPARILIAGGGIGGLASALALSRRGHRIEVLEQADAFHEIGAGVQLGPNTTRRLQALGLGVPLAAIAARPTALVVRSAASHGTIARLPLGETMQERYGAPYLCVHRSDLHSMLVNAVRTRDASDALNGSARIAEIATGDHIVCLATDDARAWEGDALIGADGLWSVVRKQVVRNDVAPRATGHTAWRALIEMSSLPVALRNVDRVDVWLGPRLHAVAYPVRGGAALNVIVVAESAPAGDVRDWDQASSLDALKQATGNTDAPLQALLEAMPSWRAWTLFDRAPLTSPGDMADGRIALLGDAAHPMLPYLAQGAGMAIEDALALADALRDGGARDVPAAFRRYAEARWQRNARVQARARRNGDIFHAVGPVRLGRDMAMRTLGARLLDQPWLYSG